mmetsp:Transcript_2907/g.10618  ORF Transcript_2907/g.10618 Transcript_2907/m.10618 type:complete len:98 (+) Transcript_2907:1091-1384(+)
MGEESPSNGRHMLEFADGEEEPGSRRPLQRVRVEGVSSQTWRSTGRTEITLALEQTQGLAFLGFCWSLYFKHGGADAGEFVVVPMTQEELDSELRVG